MKQLLLSALLLSPILTFAQGVSIGATAPDASAALDIVSSSKGVLLPRVANATTLASPATGLIVYQTGSPAGYFYNAGTPAAPAWQQLLTAGSTAFIQNGTSQQAGSSFNISGNGTIGGNNTVVGNEAVGGTQTVVGTSLVGGLLTASGGLTVAGAINLNTGSSTAATNIGTGANAGAVAIGRSGGTVTVPRLTTAGLVTTDASGNLGSQAQPTLGVSSQTLTLTSGSSSSSVSLPIVVSGSFANPGSTTPYFVSPGQVNATADVTTASYYSGAGTYAARIYGISAPKSGRVLFSFKALTIPYNGALYAPETITLQLYVNGVYTNLSATAVSSSISYGSASASNPTGISVTAGDIIAFRVTESSADPYLQVFTTLTVQ